MHSLPFRPVVFLSLAASAVVLALGCRPAAEVAEISASAAPVPASPTPAAQLEAAAVIASPSATVQLEPTPTPSPKSVPPAPPTATPTPVHSSPPYVPIAPPKPPQPSGPTSDPPLVEVWVADYRPNWIGFAAADGQVTIVEPDGAGGTKPTRHGIASPVHGQPLTLTTTTADGTIATWVFRPTDQQAFNSLLAEWQSQLRREQVLRQSAATQAVAQAAAAAYAGPCTVGVLEHDMRMTFAGDQRHQWCDMLTGGSAPMLAGLSVRYDAAAQPSGLERVCQVELPGEVSVVVLDSGGHLYGNAACGRLQWLAKDPAPRHFERWAAVGDLLNGMQAVQPATRALRQATEFDSILKDYAESWQREQAAYAKEQADAAKAQTCVQVTTVSVDATSVDVAANSFSVRDTSLGLRQQAIADARKPLADGLGQLDQTIATIAASSPSSVAEAQAIADAGHAQLDATDTAVAEAKRTASDYDAKAAELNAEAKVLAAGLSCQH